MVGLVWWGGVCGFVLVCVRRCGNVCVCFVL